MAQLASTTVFGELVVTNNTKIMGHVGVGIDNPIRIVDILSPTAGENGGIVIRSATDNTRVAGHIWPGTGGFVIDAKAGDLTGSANLHLRTGGQERIYIDGATGNVGIGTTSPSHKLDVSGTARVTGALTLGTQASSTDHAVRADRSITIQGETNVTVTGGTQNLTANRTWTLGWSGVLSVARGGTGRSSLTAGQILFGAGTSQVGLDGNLFWDNSNKRLGIGTASPSANLHVAGTTRITGNTTMQGDLLIEKANTWLTLKSPTSGGNGVEQAAGISIGEAGYKGSAALHITYTGDGYGHIGMGTVNASTSLPAQEAIRLYYQNNNVQFLGNVGIGTTSPSARLHVSGTARVDGVLNQNASSNGRLVLPVGSNKWAT